MAMVQLTPAVRRYLSAFDLIAIYVTAEDRVHVGRNPAGAVAAWWVKSRAMARKIALAIDNAHPPADRVVSAAAKLGVLLTEHATVVARATAAAARISRYISEAQANGGLKFFNAEYKRRRTEAAAAGKRFITYGQARARLQKAIAKGAATGAMVTPKLIADVLNCLASGDGR